MDRFKKKTLRFRVSPKKYLESAREKKKFDQLGTLRNLNENEPPKEPMEHQPSSRMKMLMKWKVEKLLKKQQESKLKKPIFKNTFTSKGFSPNPPKSSGPVLRGVQPASKIKPKIEQPFPKPKIVRKSALATNLKKSGTGLKTKAVSKLSLKKSPLEMKDNSREGAFPCTLSRVELLETSFAPEDFTFSVSINVKDSPHLKEGASNIFMQVLNEKQMTSTPKQKTNKSEDGSSDKATDGVLSLKKDCKIIFDDSIPKKHENSQLNNHEPEEVMNQNQCVTSVNNSYIQALTQQEIKSENYDTFIKRESIENITNTDIFETRTKIQVIELTGDKQNIKYEEVEESHLQSDNKEENGKSWDVLPERNIDDVSKVDEFDIVSKLNLLDIGNAAASISNFKDVGFLENFHLKKSFAGERKSNAFATSNRNPSAHPNHGSINKNIENSTTPSKQTAKKSRANLPLDLTPRRSLRLAKQKETNSSNLLFHVRRLFNSSDSGSPATTVTPKPAIKYEESNLSYDFDKLDKDMSESSEVPRLQMSTRCGIRKVSLLFTPQKPQESTDDKCIPDDLMSFSPSV